jgi:hypothetical protein
MCKLPRNIYLQTLSKRWTGKVEETYTCRYLNGVPLKDGEDALLVNWCELTVSPVQMAKWSTKTNLPPITSLAMTRWQRLS